MTKRLELLVASRLLDEVQRDIAASLDATFTDTRDPAGYLAEHGIECDAVMISLDTDMPAGQIEALPASVRALATYSVGTDHIDLEAATRRGLAVFNTPGVLADAVAENALFLMLGAARRATESIDLLRSRRWTGWSATQLVGVELQGRRLGVIGLGDIGSRIATRARALGMEVLYCNRKPLPEDHHVGGRFCETPAALIAESDVLVLACPSTDETRGMIDSALLAEARPGLILVNIARGDLIDDRALIAALREGRVWAAGLDVFAGEPDLHPAYFDLPNVFMLPHIGSSTLEARRGMGRILVEALCEWAAGGRPANQVC